MLRLFLLAWTALLGAHLLSLLGVISRQGEGGEPWWALLMWAGAGGAYAWLLALGWPGPELRGALRRWLLATLSPVVVLAGALSWTLQVGTAVMLVGLLFGPPLSVALTFRSHPLRAFVVVGGGWSAVALGWLALGGLDFNVAGPTEAALALVMLDLVAAASLAVTASGVSRTSGQVLSARSGGG